MKNLILKIFDFVFPRRENDAAICDISPENFYKNIPRCCGEIYPNMRAIFHYQHPTAKAMIKELKSSNSKHAARIAAYALANFFEEEGIREAIIIPMTISKNRRKKRGYNQCELLAEFFMLEIHARETSAKEILDQNSKNMNYDLRIKKSANDSSIKSYFFNLKPDQCVQNKNEREISEAECRDSETNFEIRTDILEKPFDTPKLAFENRVTRLRSAKGVFRALCTLSQTEKRIVVIDDVITTGSTMRSAMDTLHSAGAKNICGVGIAH